MVDESSLDIPSLEVLGALHNICASAQFAHAPQLQRFLRFIVARALENDEQSIKAYTIGVEALGRPADFDPDNNSIVRVEAVRLRKALDAYYRESGKNDEIRIRIRTGRYVPTFERYTAGVGASATATHFRVIPNRWSHHPRRLLGWPGLVLVVLMTVVVIAALELLVDIDYPLHAAFEALRGKTEHLRF